VIIVAIGGFLGDHVVAHWEDGELRVDPPSVEVVLRTQDTPLRGHPAIGSMDTIDLEDAHGFMVAFATLIEGATFEGDLPKSTPIPKGAAA
jgi:hypothetical protein